MIRIKSSFIGAVLMTLLLGACVPAGEKQTVAADIVPSEWSKGASYKPMNQQEMDNFKLVSWKNFFVSPQMQTIIQTALDNNRDLRVAALQVEQTRAQYQIERSAILPTLQATATGTEQKFPENASFMGFNMGMSSYTVGLGIPSYELDLFGRIRNLSKSALQTYFSTEEARKTAQISLIAQTANAYLTYLADQKLLAVTENTLKAQAASFNLIQKRYAIGIGTQLDVEQARSALETAKTNRIRYTRLVAQDKNALELLVGKKLDDTVLNGLTLDTVVLMDDLPVGLPSKVLLARPDVRSAEHNMQAANADIEVARAAFFPNISLTGTAGLSSQNLDSLFEYESMWAWNYGPQITLPIFTNGKNTATFESATASQKIAVANYEKAIQTSFKEVSNELAARGTYTKQLNTQKNLVQSLRNSYHISNARYQKGIDSYLTVLDSQRELYNAEQSQITVEQERLMNLVTLYKVLGGGVF